MQRGETNWPAIEAYLVKHAFPNVSAAVSEWKACRGFSLSPPPPMRPRADCGWLPILSYKKTRVVLWAHIQEPQCATLMADKHPWKGLVGKGGAPKANRLLRKLYVLYFGRRMPESHRPFLPKEGYYWPLLCTDMGQSFPKAPLVSSESDSSEGDVAPLVPVSLPAWGGSAPDTEDPRDRFERWILLAREAKLRASEASGDRSGDSPPPVNRCCGPCGNDPLDMTFEDGPADDEGLAACFRIVLDDSGLRRVSGAELEAVREEERARCPRPRRVLVPMPWPKEIVTLPTRRVDSDGE